MSRWKRFKAYFVAKLIKFSLDAVLMTCRFRFMGMEDFCELAKREKCLLMLWHNRLAIVPYILSRYTPQINYKAVVSASRDGEILSSIIHSCKNGGTIRVPHLGRYQALQEIIRHIEERKSVVIITPDGPKGPCYELKPGVAIAALQTKAFVVNFDWEAKCFWELKTWDRFRLPKPFTTIVVTFSKAVAPSHDSSLTLEKMKADLFHILSKR